MRLGSICLGAILFLLFSSCDKESGDVLLGNEISFLTNVDPEVGSDRDTVSSLTKSDEVGIFLLRSGTTLSHNNIVSGVDNGRFITNGNGVFRSEDLSAFYPADGSSLDAIGYYPYSRQLEDYRYFIDLSDQSDQRRLDFLVSKNLNNIVEGAGGSQELAFERQLAKIQLNLTSSRSIQNVTVRLKGMRSRGNYDFKSHQLIPADNSYGDISAKVTQADANTATVEVTIFPITIQSQESMLIRLSDGSEYTWELTHAQEFQKGYRYVYDIELEGSTVVPSGPPTTYFETPELSADGDRIVYVVHNTPEDAGKRNYAMLYDNEYKMAYWVAYPLHSSYIGSSGRSDAWDYDPRIEQTNQPRLFSGFGISGIDRGHQIPSGDRTATRALNATTFYFSNMTAQNSRLNQGMWANLENKIRDWVNKGDTLYVVTGAMPTTRTNTTIEYVNDNYGQPVARPKYYFKALAVRQGSQYQTIAFKMDNNTPADGTTYNSFRLSVKELEEETGFRFFTNVPEGEKSTVDNNFWQ